MTLSWQATPLTRQCVLASFVDVSIVYANTQDMSKQHLLADNFPLGDCLASKLVASSFLYSNPGCAKLTFAKNLAQTIQLNNVFVVPALAVTA